MTLVTLFALVPVAAFLLGRDALAVLLAAANVVIIFASLWYLFGGGEAAPAGTEQAD